MKNQPINPAAVYPPAQLAALRLQYSEEQIQLFANTFTGWEEEDDAYEDLSSRWAYRTLQETTAAVFVFGHSADPNDAHVYNAVFASKAKHVYFGVFRPDAEKLAALDGELAKYKKLGGDDVPYSFFDSETAHVWDGPPQ